MDRGHGHTRVIARNPQRLQHGLPPGLPVVQCRTLPSGIATHPEPQPLTPQRRAHHLLLRVEPRQHRAVLRRHPARRQTGDRRGHAGRLVGVRAVHGAADPHAIPAAGIQLQVIGPVRRRPQDAVRAPHDLRGRTVVHGQIDVGRQRGELIGEPQQIVTARPRERVDRLRGIAHHAHVPVIPQPQPHQPMLQRRHILVLVHRQPADRGADGGADLREPVQQVAGNQQDVVEIDLPL